MAAERRVVVLGKSGAGKSSLGNTIFGGDVFSVNHSPNSQTTVCRSVTRTVNGTRLTLIDTPGLFNTNPNTAVITPEIMRCLEECTPGPHAFLLVLKVERYTEQEQIVVDLIVQCFSAEALRYTTVVFTYGDELPSGMRIQDWAQQNPALRRLLEKCDNRCHVVDNRHWRSQREIYRNNRNQVQDLLQTIELTVRRNGGSYFTSDLLQNRSLWQRFKDAPLWVQIPIVLGVAVVGYLLYTYVPWATVIEWIIQGAKNGATWIWQNLPTTAQIKAAIEYLSELYNLFQRAEMVIRFVTTVSPAACSMM